MAHVERTVSEDGLPKGTWNINHYHYHYHYHCMMTDDGIVVIWNGDGSLRMTLTPSR